MFWHGPTRSCNKKCCMTLPEGLGKRRNVVGCRLKICQSFIGKLIVTTIITVENLSKIKDVMQLVAVFILDAYPLAIFPFVNMYFKRGLASWNIIILIIAITSDTAHDPNSELNGVTDSDKSPSMKSSKIFSLPNHMGTLLPVLETVSPSDSLFSTNRVSCVMEQKNVNTHGIHPCHVHSV